MSDKPRRWFQIHLSTAIVLTFVAGPMIAMNIEERQGRYVIAGAHASPYEDVQDSPVGQYQLFTRYIGWPLPYWEYYSAEGKNYGSYPVMLGPLIPICVNAAVFFGTLLLVYFFLERRIRCHEAGK